VAAILQCRIHDAERCNEPDRSTAVRDVTRQRGSPGEAVYRLGRLTASYVHLYFPSNPDAAASLFLP